MKYKLRKSGYTLCFYYKQNDSKLSFFIENEPELTDRILANVKTKRVKIKDIKYVYQAIDILIINNQLNKKTMSQNENPIIELGELMQKKYGKNIEFTIPEKTGPDHCPRIEVAVILPTGKPYLGVGSNQKIARRNACELALSELQNIKS